ncbi:hypothetical protein KIW84_057436 [Lathyrus oleraceus]|uniref:Uncharacterized protein n=1 Tax=Pisum sativum TaxID=3888 RepID=A0A9D5AL23_PEA|nr:hypothetical protein KIW84_057436 [Pisum sativum]
MQKLPSCFAKESGDEIAPYATLRDPKDNEFEDLIYPPELDAFVNKLMLFKDANEGDDSNKECFVAMDYGNTPTNKTLGKRSIDSIESIVIDDIDGVVSSVTKGRKIPCVKIEKTY